MSALPPLSHSPVPASAAPSQSETTESLRLSLVCPNCGGSGWISWDRLSHGMRCGKCKCEFLLGKGGRTQSIAKLPHVRYTCPRCGMSGSVPKMLTIRGTQCGSCKLELVPGEDSRLHSAADIARMRKATAQAKPEPTGEGLLSRLLERMAIPETHRRNLCRGVIALVAVAVLVSGGLAIGSLFDNSPHAAARRFTTACLTGKKKAPLPYLPKDDEVERIELNRWWGYYFPSISNDIRPSGDKVKVEVETIAETPEYTVLRVVLRSKHLGERGHDQVWRHEEEGWRFIPTATLRRLEER